MSRPSTLIVVNPSSGRNAAIEWAKGRADELERLLAPCDVVVTSGAGDAERASAVAVARGIGRVVAVGGDGTFNEVVNGVARAGGLATTCFGLIPMGTGNDLARALGIPDEPDDALAAIVADLHRRVDVGLMNGRCFVNASAGGFVGKVSSRADSWLKTWFGTAAYVAAGASALVDHEPMRTTVVADGVRHVFDLELFVVSNGPYIGGGHQVSPAARLDDGRLDMVAVKSCDRLELLAQLQRLSRGDVGEDSDVAVRLRASQLTLAFDRHVQVNTDGEVLQAERCDYRTLPRALSIAVPPGAALRDEQEAVTPQAVR